MTHWKLGSLGYFRLSGLWNRSGTGDWEWLGCETTETTVKELFPVIVLTCSLHFSTQPKARVTSSHNLLVQCAIVRTSLPMGVPDSEGIVHPSLHPAAQKDRHPARLIPTYRDMYTHTYLYIYISSYSSISVYLYIYISLFFFSLSLYMHIPHDLWYIIYR